MFYNLGITSLPALDLLLLIRSGLSPTLWCEREKSIFETLNNVYYFLTGILLYIFVIRKIDFPKIELKTYQ